MELYDLTITEASALIRRRELSPVALTRACLERIERVEPQVNAFITVLAEPALGEAEIAEAEVAAGRYRGPLHGIPIGVKDLYDTAGVRTTAGSKVFADRVPTVDAALVTRLKDAGAIIVGKLNLHEFAYGVTGGASHFGPTRNPWDISRICGGSSSGSAAAVTAGECLGSLGTDTAASIRLPAALCSIVGLKPTYDLLSRRGVIPLAWSLDHCGPMAHSTTDVALMLGALVGSGLDYTVGLNGRLGGLRIGVPRHYFHKDTSAEVLAAFESALQTLRELGASVREVTMPSLAHVYPALAAIIATEPLSYHLPLLRDRADDYTVGIRTRLENGLLYTAAHYLQARRIRTVIMEEVRATLTDVDLLATPTAPFTALEISEDLELLPQTRLLNHYTRPWNLTGLPAISLPCGFDSLALPIGLQLIARPFEEAALLHAAYAYEQHSEWHNHRPPILQEL